MSFLAFIDEKTLIYIVLINIYSDMKLLFHFIRIHQIHCWSICNYETIIQEDFGSWIALNLGSEEVAINFTAVLLCLDCRAIFKSIVKFAILVSSDNHTNKYLPLGGTNWKKTYLLSIITQIMLLLDRSNNK